MIYEEIPVLHKIGLRPERKHKTPFIRVYTPNINYKQRSIRNENTKITLFRS